MPRILGEGRGIREIESLVILLIAIIASRLSFIVVNLSIPSPFISKSTRHVVGAIEIPSALIL